MLSQIKEDAYFLPEDKEKQLIVLDLTRHKRRIATQKQLAYLLFPEAQGVVEIKNLFRDNVKTNDLTISISLSMNLSTVEHSKDVGDILRHLNIGSGHKGAGAGVIQSKSKNEMLKAKEIVVKKIYEMFTSQ